MNTKKIYKEIIANVRKDFDDWILVKGQLFLYFLNKIKIPPLITIAEKNDGNIFLADKNGYLLLKKPVCIDHYIFAEFSTGWYFGSRKVTRSWNRIIFHENGLADLTDESGSGKCRQDGLDKTLFSFDELKRVKKHFKQNKPPTKTNKIKDIGWSKYINKSQVKKDYNKKLPLIYGGIIRLHYFNDFENLHKCLGDKWINANKTRKRKFMEIKKTVKGTICNIKTSNKKGRVPNPYKDEVMKAAKKLHEKNPSIPKAKMVYKREILDAINADKSGFKDKKPTEGEYKKRFEVSPRTILSYINEALKN